MQYFLTVPHDSAIEPTMESETQRDPAGFKKLFADVEKLNNDMKDSGVFRFAGGLQPPSTAKTVDGTTDDIKILDEPFVVADSYVGGFWVIETDAKEEAMKWTERAARVLRGRIEIRELQ